METEDQQTAAQELEEVESEVVEESAASDYPTGACLFTAEWGTVSVQVSADGMEACLLAVTPAVPDVVVDAARITTLLQANHIVYGLLSAKIGQIAGEVNGVDGWSGRVQVAEGRPPGIPGRLEYTAFGPEAEVTVASVDSWEVNGKGLHFGPLRKFFQRYRGPGEDPEFAAKAIGAGEIIAIRQDPLKGRSGSDIFGRAIKAPQFCELIAEENVNLVGMRQFTATHFGYLFVDNRRLSILSPIVKDDADMMAWYVNLRQFPPPRQPSPAEIRQAIDQAGVSQGVLEHEIIQLCAALAEGRAPVWNVVAQGMPAVPGEDGRLQFSAERGKVAGRIRQDGSMDMRDLNLIQTAEAGDLVAVLLPPTAGKTGYTLSGLELETTSGQDLKVEAKDNVRVEDGEDGTVCFFAEQPGLIVYHNDKISIDPLYLIKGNVDFSTGNIEVDCNLQINGSICSDFIVKSSKNVLVAGAVEPGAKITVVGDLEVKGGILGETTEVTVLGNLQAEYIQAAKVVVKGDIHVRQYIYFAFVRCVGAIEVGPGSGKRGGSIAGGTVCSSSTIRAKSCGSPSNVPTTLDLEPHPKQMAALKALSRAIKECQAHLQMVKKTLNLENLDLQELQDKWRDAAQGEAKAVFAKLLEDVKGNLDKIAELSKAKGIVKQKIKEHAATMRMVISDHCYGNTLIRICGKELLDKNDRGPTTFIFKDGEVVIDSGELHKHKGGDTEHLSESPDSF